MTMASTSEFDVAMVAVVLAMMVAIVWTVAHHWHKTRLAAYSARLKQLMIERGMSASEIERVLHAGDNTDAGEHFQRSVGIAIRRAFEGDCCAEAKNVEGDRH